ncbi:DEAD/DEAH box helicase [Chitinivorax sp. PXF-14]|uniref:DEAD/DEAH box helicase n=1 Tax=Chitinivorax sp. PXF-14 TaxID=3230488 RepID=UPI0034677A04
MSDTTFASLGLAEPILHAVADSGYTSPTPIQAQAIPLVLAGHDVLAAAQTGTGKTAGFTLPLLHRLSLGEKTVIPAHPRALILTPTRELAAQVEESVATYGKNLKLRSKTVFGGVALSPQVKAVKTRIDILVATPGRLLELVGKEILDLSGVETLVLDEADRMLDMGFIHDVRKILALLPAKRQNLLFSATFSDDIRKLAGGFMRDPRLVSVAPPNTTAERIAQTVHLVDREKKRELLTHLIQSQSWRQVLVFMRTKHGANRLAEYLEKHGVAAAAIHGNKSQGARTKALAGFKDGSIPVLVATDIAARGLDIEQLPHVVNFELPNVAEDYVHRIGRTGRAGASGEAISLVCVDELKLLDDIEKLTGVAVPRVDIPGFEADLSRPPEPIQRGRQGDDDERGPRQQRQGRGQQQRQGGGQQKQQKPQGRQDKAPQDKPAADATQQGQQGQGQQRQGRQQAQPQGKGPRQPAQQQGAPAGQQQARQKNRPPPPRQPGNSINYDENQPVNLPPPPPRISLTMHELGGSDPTQGYINYGNPGSARQGQGRGQGQQRAQGHGQGQPRAQGQGQGQGQGNNRKKGGGGRPQGQGGFGNKPRGR